MAGHSTDIAICTLSLIPPANSKARRFSYVPISMVLGIVTNEGLNDILDVWEAAMGDRSIARAHSYMINISLFCTKRMKALDELCPSHSSWMNT